VPTSLDAASLLRSVGLLVDGPVPWDRPVGERGPGVFVVELSASRPTAPIELTRVGKWIERVPGLRLDGERPTSRALSARLAAFWLPDQVVVYVGATKASVGGRVAALQRTVLGDRRPHSGGHWLHTLTPAILASTRIWWAATDAAEEYEDAILDAFAASLSATERAAIPSGDTLALPFGNLRHPSAGARPTGLTGSLLPLPDAPAPPPPTRVTVLPDGDADGVGEEKRHRPVGGRGMGRIAAAAAYAAQGSPRQPRARSVGSDRATSRSAGVPNPAPSPAPAVLTAEGAERLQAELRTLVEIRRPEVIARIKAAKELGDLRENADYTAAREEQSFLEGRIQALEARLRNAVIVGAGDGSGAGDDGDAGERPGGVGTAGRRDRGAGIGSYVTVEVDGSSVTYQLVGSAEADSRAGRISIASPVGAALVGARTGDEVVAATPRGPVRHRVLSVD
jgi:transcription elongation factor GreA